MKKIIALSVLVLTSFSTSSILAVSKPTPNFSSATLTNNLIVYSCCIKGGFGSTPVWFGGTCDSLQGSKVDKCTKTSSVYAAPPSTTLADITYTIDANFQQKSLISDTINVPSYTFAK